MKQILILNYENCRNCEIQRKEECPYFVKRENHCLYKNKQEIENKLIQTLEKINTSL